MRIGMGYDVHRLVEGRDLVLGGVKIEYEKGLLGHSDADVLLHAIMDALLGAAALGDIGKHFPDTDEKYKGADSMKLRGTADNNGRVIQMTERSDGDMKATGIVRRIDSCVILGAKAESLENTGFSLISVHFSIPKTVMLLPSQRQ